MVSQMAISDANERLSISANAIENLGRGRDASPTELDLVQIYALHDCLQNALTILNCHRRNASRRRHFLAHVW
jgi:hypothetical protein